tara:strand:+ start:91 stop:429 length:339 start_codon:yes stop_codon:yes gene_type:complete
MQKILLFFFCFPLFCFASFPVEDGLQLSDTVIINGKIYIGAGVDSTSNYPLEKETLSEYRERLKNQKFNKNTSYVKKPINWGRIILIVLLVGAVLGYLLLLSVVNYFADNIS